MHYAILITVRHIVNLALTSLPKKKEPIIPLSLFFDRMSNLSLIPYTTPQQQ